MILGCAGGAMAPGAMNPGMHLGMGVAAGAAASSNPGMPGMNHSMQAVSTTTSCKLASTASLQIYAVDPLAASEMLPVYDNFAFHQHSSFMAYCRS